MTLDWVGVFRRFHEPWRTGNSHCLVRCETLRRFATTPPSFFHKFRDVKMGNIGIGCFEVWLTVVKRFQGAAVCRPEQENALGQLAQVCATYARNSRSIRHTPGRQNWGSATLNSKPGKCQIPQSRVSGRVTLQAVRDVVFSDSRPGLHDWHVQSCWKPLLLAMQLSDKTLQQRGALKSGSRS